LHSGTAPQAGRLDKIRPVGKWPNFDTPRSNHRPPETIGKRAKTNELILRRDWDFIMRLRLAGITRESVVDGPGIRVVIYAQGCPHGCPGCQNPDTHDPNGGKLFDVGQVVQMIRSVPMAQGVTFSGGEPFSQAEAFAELGHMLKSSSLDIVTYTGYVWEDLVSSSRDTWHDLLSLTTLLVDGPFYEDERDLGLAFRGSRNQRVIDVAKSLEKNAPVVVSDTYDACRRP
jgi:anaerobic ribonucleoside-triphosphate reductase activating protein